MEPIPAALSSVSRKRRSDGVLRSASGRFRRTECRFAERQVISRFQHLSGQLFRSGESVENGRYVERAQGRQHFVVGFDTVQDNRQPASAGDLQLPNQPFALCRSVDRYGVVEPDFADRRAGSVSSCRSPCGSAFSLSHGWMPAEKSEPSEGTASVPSRIDRKAAASGSFRCVWMSISGYICEK